MNAQFLQLGDVFVGYDSADDEENVCKSGLSNAFNNLRNKRIMRPRQNTQSYYMDVFLYRRIDDHIRSLVKTRIDDLESGVAKRPGNYFGATIVAIEPGLRHQYPDLPLV